MCVRCGEMAAEVERLSHERQCLAEAIVRIAVASGDTRTEFTGPDLLMACGDAAEGIKHLTAENARLQSVIDEANAQEHIATIGDTWGLFWRGADLIADTASKHGLRIGDKLYARPIPAQQSQGGVCGTLWCDSHNEDEIIESEDCDTLSNAVVNLWEDIRCLKEDIASKITTQQSPAVAVPEKYVINTREHTKSKIYKQGWNDAVDAMLTSKPSPLNTEQDTIYDLDKMSWDSIKLAAKESNWIPKEYFMNDWVSDVCSFLRDRRVERITEQDARKIIYSFAEVERLQSVIDEANAQEAFVTTCFPDPEDEREGVRFSLRDWKKLNDLPSNTKLYARPIPAQQSPAVAVHEPSELDVYRWFQESTVVHHIEEDGAHISKRAMFLAKKAIEFAQQSPCITEQDSELSLHRADYNAIKSDGFESPGELLAAHKYLLANRITEQDAREIARQFNIFRSQGHGLAPDGIINKWLRSDEGRALLSKLNGDQNGK